MTYLLNGLVMSIRLLDFIKVREKKKNLAINQIDMNF